MTRAWPPLSPEDLEHAHRVLGAQRWDALRGGHVFMTGGTGFVGKWLLATLIDADRRFDLGCRITVLTRDADAFRRSAPDLATSAGVGLVTGDVRSFELADSSVSHVVHAATDVVARSRALDIFDTCVEGTRRVLDLAKSAKARVLLVSSGAVYGPQPTSMERIGEDFPGGPDPLRADSAYGEGKRAAEWLAAAHAAEFELPVVIARCFAFVGPYLPLDRHFAIGNFLRDALAGNPIVIEGDGTPLRSYLHGADMAAWLWAALFTGRPGVAYNVGGTEEVSIAELARRVVAATGSTSSIEVRTVPVAGRPAARYVPDVARARRELQLAEPSGLDEAIARTARWHRQASAG